MTQGPDADDQLSVRSWISAWGDEVAGANVSAGRLRFAEELTAFGTHADVVRGRDAVEANQWRQIWPAIDDFRFAVDDMDILLSPDRLMAVAVVRWDSTGIHRDGSRFDRPGRATVVLRRTTVSEEWLGVHTHFSLGRGVAQETHGTREVR